MDINQLRYFVSIAQSGSILGTSKEFIISRSAISKALSRLEEELGTELFVRNTDGVSLTQEGRRLLPYARKAVDSFDQVKKEVHPSNVGMENLKIGFSYGTNPFFEKELAHFAARNPSIRIQEYHVDVNHAQALLRNGEIDICVVDRIYNDEGLIQKPVLWERVLYGVPADSEPGKRGLLKGSELAEARILGPKEGDRSRFISMASGTRHRKKTGAMNYYSSDDMFYLISLVKQGKGILGMPEKLAAQYTVEGIAFIPSEEQKYWEISVCYLKNAFMKAVPGLIKEVFYVREFPTGK